MSQLKTFVQNSFQSYEIFLFFDLVLFWMMIDRVGSVKAKKCRCNEIICCEPVLCSWFMTHGPCNGLIPESDDDFVLCNAGGKFSALIKRYNA